LNKLTRDMARQKRWLQPLWMVLAILGIVSICAGSATTLLGRAQAVALETRLTGLEQQAGLLSSRLPLARQEFESNHLLYADHWSAGLDEALREAERSLDQAGEVFTLLHQARETQGRNRSQAHDLADRVESLLSGAASVVDTILGPYDTEGQGLYETLAWKGSRAEDHAGAAQAKISESRATLEAKLAETWNRSHGLSFAPAYAKVAEAENRLAVARETLSREVERGLIDLPLAYDQAEEARALAQNAVELAEADETNARSAWDSMEEARGRIGWARGYIEDSNYFQVQALSALAGAESTLRLAEQAFEAEQFTEAQRYAGLALSEAEDSWLVAATPTPQPPSDEDSYWGEDDSDSWDWGGDDSDTWDWGGDDSDSWDWGGDDSDSWDWGGSDSDSW
jgi:hypothetical protein